jgi:hypothetical protein
MLLFLAGAILLLGGCSPEDVGPTSVELDSGFTVGGYTYYDLGNDSGGSPTFVIKDKAVASATVSLTDPGGKVSSAISDAAGYYEIKGLNSGTYQVDVTATGYETQEFTQTLTTLDDFQTMHIRLQETRMTATVSWGSVSVVLRDGESRSHGIEGVSAQYNEAADGNITVTLSAAGSISRSATIKTCPAAPTTISATADSTNSILTFVNADVDTCVVPQSSTETLGNRDLDVSASRLTPLNSTLESFSAKLTFRVGP